MIKISSPQECCGCSACESICPKDAISMVADKMGFLYPKVDTDICIDCGLCEKACSFNDNYDKSKNIIQPIAYGMRHKNESEISRSQSGGAFVALSDWILEQGGVVYGVGYEGHFRAVHKRATTKCERDEFRGSKYVQSDLNGTFRLVKQDLQNGLIVCFSGTPCQIAGLESYIPTRLHKKLYLIDIICHGVPGPFIWRDYLNYLEKKEKNEIIAANFRDKSLGGWHSSIESYRFSDGILRTFRSDYSYFFYKHLSLRPSCGSCHFCNTKRVGDITIGDFWGVNKTDSHFAEDNKGCSLLLINTQKGKSWLNLIKPHTNLLTVPKIEDCLQWNLRRPSILHPQRTKFEKKYAQYGFDYIIKNFGKYSLFYWIEKIKGALKRIK